MGAGRLSPVRTEIERIRQIYCLDVGSARTRDVTLLGRKCDARIIQTFLGWEVKMGRKRVTCPDLVSARYVQLFACLGMKSVRIPYDPTRTRLILDGLEPCIERIRLIVEQESSSTDRRRKRLRDVYRQVRVACQCTGELPATRS